MEVEGKGKISLVILVSRSDSWIKSQLESAWPLCPSLFPT